MDRGYVRLWRKIADSRSYNRTALHRALMLTLMVQANWKSHWWRGQEILPGQVATSIRSLSDELGEPRTSIHRALSDLAKDGMITIENMGHQWTRITLINWECYQEKQKECGTPVGHQRDTDGTPVGQLKEFKNINTLTPVSNDTSVSVAQNRPQNTPKGEVLRGKRKTLTGRRKETFEEFWEVFAYKKGKADAIDAWAMIPELTNSLMEKILEAARAEAERRLDAVAQGKTPIYPQGWITGRRWEDEELQQENWRELWKRDAV